MHYPRGLYFGQWCETSFFLCTYWLLQEQCISFSLCQLDLTSQHFELVTGKVIEVNNLHRMLHNRKGHKLMRHACALSPKTTE